jgi:hypothetical protein
MEECTQTNSPRHASEVDDLGPSIHRCARRLPVPIATTITSLAEPSTDRDTSDARTGPLRRGSFGPRTRGAGGSSLHPNTSAALGVASRGPDRGAATPGGDDGEGGCSPSERRSPLSRPRYPHFTATGRSSRRSGSPIVVRTNARCGAPAPVRFGRNAWAGQHVARPEAPQGARDEIDSLKTRYASAGQRSKTM